MRRMLVTTLFVLLLGSTAWWSAACGNAAVEVTTTSTGGAGDVTDITVDPAENPIRIVFQGEITGPLVYDAAAVKKGIRTALRSLAYKVADYPVEYREFDNMSDPLLAVEQTRGLVEMDSNGDGKPDRDPIDFICGPLSSSVVAGVTFFLAQRTEPLERIPECAVTGQPSENITTSAGLGFIPNGIYSSHGFYLGKYAAENLHYKTVNCIHYADRIAQEMQAGFETGFLAGGGTIASLTYVPSGTLEFASYFAAMPQADCTLFWVRGAGAIPFVTQYAASGLTGALLVPQSSNYSESQLEYLSALGLGNDLLACDVYTPMIASQQNTQFINAYQQLYPGEYPTPEAFGGWQAIMLYAQAVQQVAAQRKLEDEVGAVAQEERVDPRDPADVVIAMKTLTMDTPAGSITMGKYGKTYVATRDFYILHSKDVGGGRIAWDIAHTYTQVRMGE